MLSLNPGDKCTVFRKISENAFAFWKLSWLNLKTEEMTDSTITDNPVEGMEPQQVTFQMLSTSCWLQTPRFLAEAVNRSSTKLMLS